jgi:hypothetical protein
MVFSTVPESSSDPPGILFSPRAFLVMKWRRDVFTWRLSLLTWGASVDGLAYPYTGLRLIAINQEDRVYLLGAILSCRNRRWHPSGERKLPGCRYLTKSLSSSIPVLRNITYGKLFVPGGVYPLAESWCYLGVYPRSSGVRRRRDRFYTRVCIVRHAWAPTATFFHTKRLRLTLPKSCSGRCLSTVGNS